MILGNTTSAGDTLGPWYWPHMGSYKTHRKQAVSLREEIPDNLAGVKCYIHTCITRFGCPLFRRLTSSDRSAAAPSTVQLHLEKHLQIQFSP